MKLHAAAIALLLACTGTAQAACGILLSDTDFEAQKDEKLARPWVPEGYVGVHFNEGFAHGGRNNAWAMGQTGWHGIRQSVFLQAGANYKFSVWVKTATNFREGAIGIRGSNQELEAETKFGPSDDRYGQVIVSFTPKKTGNYRAFAGMTGSGEDSWVRFDDFRLDANCGGATASSTAVRRIANDAAVLGGEKPEANNQPATGEMDWSKATKFNAATPTR